MKRSCQAAEILARGVSTRNYREVLPAMVESVGVGRGRSKNVVSREFVDASETKLKELIERRFDDTKLLATRLDGVDRVFGSKNPVPRRRNRKIVNVFAKPPEEVRDQLRAALPEHEKRFHTVMGYSEFDRKEVGA